MPPLPPLPAHPGPSLRPFDFKDVKKAHIEFLEYIGHGAHSRVYKVRIDGKLYALKVVCWVLVF